MSNYHDNLRNQHIIEFCNNRRWRDLLFKQFVEWTPDQDKGPELYFNHFVNYARGIRLEAYTNVREFKANTGTIHIYVFRVDRNPAEYLGRWEYGHHAPCDVNSNPAETLSVFKYVTSYATDHAYLRICADEDERQQRLQEANEVCGQEILDGVWWILGKVLEGLDYIVRKS